MKTLFNPESETLASIERLEIEARDTLHRLKNARLPEDQRVLNKLLNELKQQIQFLRRRLDA